MTTKRLIVRWSGELVGELSQGEGGKLSFVYGESWRKKGRPRALSFSLPVRPEPYDSDACHNFFGGYLPADRQIRTELARIFETKRGDFALLSALGRDCAGALTLHPEGMSVASDARRLPAFRTLEEWEFADKLRELETKPLLAGPEGLRLSLAGAQSKTAVYVDKHDRIGLTQNDYPTSHIVKPEINDRLPDLALNEYLCLELGRRVGLEVPAVELRFVEGIPYLLIERYDRRLDDEGRVARIHQEDFCQALGVPAENKYEADDGPNLEKCFEVVNRLVTPATERLRLLDVVVFNALIGNTDAHAKNFSILYDPPGGRLAPLYDVVCGVVYPEEIDTRMAMKIGGHYRANDLMRRHWERFAADVGFPLPAFRKRLDAMSRQLQIRARELERDLIERGLATDVSRRIVDEILRRSHAVRDEFGFGAVPDEDLVGREWQVDVHEHVKISDRPPHPGVTSGPDAYRRRYRAVMARIGADRRRARLAGSSEEERDLLALSQRLAQAYEAWRSGATHDSMALSLLRDEVGPLPPLE